MNGRWSWIGGGLLVALMFGMVAVPEADARGGRGGGGHGGGGHGGGGGHAHAPRVSAGQRSFKAQTFKAPKMPHMVAPARNNAMRGQGRTNANAMARTNNAQTHTNNAQTRANNTQTRANRAATTATTGTGRATTGTGTATTGTGTTTAGTGTATSTTNTGLNNRGTLANNNSPYNYTYGTGTNARNYRAYGYGRGYRNRYNGQRSGYGRSQGNNRAVVSQLRSVHRNLAQIDSDYRGHRVRAMHSVSMAIRQLSHRSMVYRNSGFANGMNNNNNLALGGKRQGGLNGNAAGRRNQNQNRNQRIPQAQSDSRMSQSLRTLQGVNMQLSSQGSNTSGHARARGHVQHAMHELNTALTIR